ncbi:MAG: hypothetical protein N4A72_03955 [Bacteroidales bacterium]|jgi:hypothetical protein|nr:hypothetical protein [Bacteroidales bacterium]
MTDEELNEILEEQKKTHDRFMMYERDGIQNTLKYFDRIHDKLFAFNNILIAGYFALSQVFESFSVYGIIIPLLNLALLIFIEYRMMKKSRFESEITKKIPSEIDKNGFSISKTNRYSLYAIISTTIVIGIFVYNLFSLDSKELQTCGNTESKNHNVKVDISEKNLMLDSILIGKWYNFISDKVTFYFKEDTDTLKILGIINDTLIIEHNSIIEDIKDRGKS